MDTLDDGPVVAVPDPRRLSDRASDFRIILGARREADGILAEASEVRHDAGRQAELLVAEAEALSRDLTDQARSVLDQATGEARERAEGIVAIARAAGEEIRRSADARVAIDREAFRAEMESARRELASAEGQTGKAALAEIEATIRSLATMLRRAQESVTDAEGVIDLLRTEMAGTLPDAGAGASKPASQDQPADSTELRPLGWLFRADRSEERR